MVLNEKKIRRLVRRILLEASSYDFEQDFTLNNDLVVKAARKEDKYFFTELPSNHKYNGQEVTEKNPLPFDKADPKLKAHYTQLMKTAENKSAPSDAKKIDPPGKYGMPVLVANNKGSKPISKNILSFLNEGLHIEKILLEYDPGFYGDYIGDDNTAGGETVAGMSAKGTKNAMRKLVSKIPEGHVNLIVIEPRTRTPYLINFGVYDPADGGNPKCQKVNDNIISSFMQATAGIIGFSLMGTVSVYSLGKPVDMVTKKTKDGEDYLEFKDLTAACKDLFSRSGAPFTYADAEIGYIPNCKHNSKVLATARTEVCRMYNMVPETSGAAALDVMNQLISKHEGKGDSLYGPGSDNCATFTAKLVMTARKGTISSMTSLARLTQLPTAAVSELVKLFNGTKVT